MYPDRLTLLRRANWLATGAVALALSVFSTSQQVHLPASEGTGPNGGSEETIHYDEAGHSHFL